MERIENTSNTIVDGVIWKGLLKFFFPIMLGTLFQQLYNTVDAVVVGQFVGTQALAAVGGSSSQIVNLFIGFFVGLSSGRRSSSRSISARARTKASPARCTPRWRSRSSPARS